MKDEIGHTGLPKSIEDRLWLKAIDILDKNGREEGCTPQEESKVHSFFIMEITREEPEYSCPRVASR